MDIRVTPNKVIIDNGYIVNRQEYNVNPCEFTFTEEYTGLVKKAIFVAGNIEIERAIINDKCDIPYDVLDEKMFELRVYAYAVEDEQLVLRYSPTYAKVFLREGSYRGVTGSGEVITPTQFEQYESALNEGLDELEAGLQEVANVDIDASKSGTTATVTITNRNGVEKSVEIEDGTDYVITQEDYREIANIVEGDITPLIPTKTSDIENNSGFITKDENDMTYYTLATQTGSTIELVINSSTYVVTLNLKNKAGTTISTGSIDLPLETMVVSARYDSTTKSIILVLNNGQEVTFSVADLVSGLQSEITPSNKLNADLVDDSSSTNKFVTSADKTNWDAKVGTTDYATAGTGGVIKANGYFAIAVNSNGELICEGKTYDVYQSKPETLFISKGTLENVITGKGLVSNTDYATSSKGGVVKVGGYNVYVSNSGLLQGGTRSYASYLTDANEFIISKGTLDNVLNAKIGDIDTALDLINGEVVS